MAAYSKKKSIFILSLVILIFIGPLIGAWLFFNHVRLMATVNHGILIQPPFSVSQLNLQYEKLADRKPSEKDFRGHWVLVYSPILPCLSDCQWDLYKIRQVRTALGKDQNRIMRLVVTHTSEKREKFKELLEKSYPGTYLATGFQLPTQLIPGSLYIADPLGNIMMVYRSNFNAENLLKDLTRLCNISQIG